MFTRGGKRERGVQRTSTAEQPLVSIVTVVYNGAATLERTIQSVLAQDYPQIEETIKFGSVSSGCGTYTPPVTYDTNGPSHVPSLVFVDQGAVGRPV